jgi:hypothetical protein
MRFVAPIGAKSLTGVGLCADPDIIHTITDLLEHRGGSMEGQVQLLHSQANEDSPSPRTGKTVVGDFTGGGTLNVEVTPGGSMTKMLTMLFGEPVETFLSTVTPAAPTLAVAGTPGTTTRKYYIVARNAGNYPSIPSPAGTTTTSAAVLNVTDKVTVNWVAVAGATGYDILRSDGGASTIADAKLVKTVGAVTTTDDTGTATSAYTPTPSRFSRKTWKHGWERLWGVYAQKKGNSIDFFPFLALHSMAITTRRGDRDVIMANFGGKAGNKFQMSDENSSESAINDAMDNTGLTSAVRDARLPFSPALCFVRVAGFGEVLETSARANSIALTFDRNTLEEFSLNGRLGAQGFTDGISALDLNLTTYFKNGSEQDLKRFMGLSSSVSSESAYGFQADVKHVSVESWLSYPSGFGVNNSIMFGFPKCAYGAVSAPVGGRGEPIMQDIRVEPCLTAVDGGKADFVIEVISNEPKAYIMTESSTIVAAPVNAVQ